MNFNFFRIDKHQHGAQYQYARTVLVQKRTIALKVYTQELRHSRNY